jgi:hypothetical protein
MHVLNGSIFKWRPQEKCVAIDLVKTWRVSDEMNAPAFGNLWLIYRGTVTRQSAAERADEWGSWEVQVYRRVVCRVTRWRHIIDISTIRHQWIEHCAGCRRPVLPCTYRFRFMTVWSSADYNYSWRLSIWLISYWFVWACTAELGQVASE